MGKYLKLFDTHTEYDTFTQTEDFILPNVSHCITENHVHYNPIDPYGGHPYVEIGGLKWATMNIGATSEYPVQPTEGGYYFQWGDTQGYLFSQVGSGEGQKYFGGVDYKYGNGQSFPDGSQMTKYNDTDGKTSLDAIDDAAIVNWGGHWRMPTIEDFQLLEASVNKEWINSSNDRFGGMLCTDKTDSSKVLFFPAMGQASSGSKSGIGSFADYWTINLTITDKANAWFFGAYASYVSSTAITWNRRYEGNLIRPVAD
jgi:hypothetical protein